MQPLFLTFLTLLILHFPSLQAEKSKDKKYYLAVCALFHNEADYLKEWIEFHRLVGVEHFYLYNHRSIDKYERVLKPYIKEGIVTLKDWRQNYKTGNIAEFDMIQRSIYKDAIKTTQGKAKWVAFIDIDEFLFPVEQPNLAQFLKAYEKYPGVFVNWQIFGTSHVKSVPNRQLLIETLTKKSEQNYHWNRRVKSIVRPKMAREAINPHYFRYRNKAKAVNSDGLPFQNEFSPYIVIDKVRINHYYTRDENHFFQVKVPRRKKWYGSYSWKEWFDDLNAIEDHAILKYVEPLRKKVFLQCNQKQQES